jgi:hypothetical protein
VKYSLVANSIKSEIVLEPHIELVPQAAKTEGV